MTRDDIIRMAQKSGISCSSMGRKYAGGTLLEMLEKFANLVAAAEREACANVCEETGAYREAIEMAQECAAAIRSRGTQAK